MAYAKLPECGQEQAEHWGLTFKNPDLRDFDPVAVLAMFQDD